MSVWNGGVVGIQCSDDTDDLLLLLRIVYLASVCAIECITYYILLNTYGIFTFIAKTLYIILNCKNVYSG